MLVLSPSDPPLTIEEVAAHYRLTERQLRKFIRERQVEVLRYGHTVRFDNHALNSLEERLRCRAKEQDSESSDDPIPGRSPSSARWAAQSGSRVRELMPGDDIPSLWIVNQAQ